MKLMGAFVLSFALMALRSPPPAAADHPFSLGSSAFAHIKSNTLPADNDTMSAVLSDTGVFPAAVVTLKICGQVPRHKGKVIRAQDLKTVVLGTGLNSVATTYEYCSGGKLRIDAAKSVFRDVDIGCPFRKYPGTCGELYNNLRSYEERAQRIVSKRARWYIFVMPGHSCGWAGQGETSGDTSFYNSKFGYDLSVLIHEMGHTLGLQHPRSIPRTTDPIIPKLYGGTTGSAENLEYGDWSSQMSSTINAPSCFNLPQQRSIAWSDPPTLNKDSLTPGTWLKLTMPDAFADPRAGRRIDPNWMRPHPRKYVYVSWVPALGSNRGLHPNFRDKVYVHVSTDNINDMTVMVARLSRGQRWSSGQLGWRADDLVVHFHSTGGPVENKLLAAVSICRKGSGQTCNFGGKGSTRSRISDFPLESANGRFIARRNEDWKLVAPAGQWRRFYRTASPEDCGRACYYLPTCGYFQWLKNRTFPTKSGQNENCALFAQGAIRGKTVTDSRVVSGVVRRARPPAPREPPPPSLPRRAAMVLYLDAATVNSADLSARTWRDLSGKGNHMKLAPLVTRSNSYGASMQFVGARASYARRTNLTMGSNPGKAWTGIVWYRGTDSLLNGRVLMQLNLYPAAGTTQPNFYDSMLWSTDSWSESSRDQPFGYDYTPQLPTYMYSAECWQMLAVVKSAQDITFYWNEQIIGPFPKQSDVTWGTKEFVIGKDFYYDRDHLNGHISVVLMYNQALNGNEVNAVYRRYRSRYGDTICQRDVPSG